MKMWRAKKGFSLLEVMVAVAILGLVMTVILSAQGGIVSRNQSAARMAMATTIGRCKMSELEEKLIRFGYPEIDQFDNDVVCCDEHEVPGFNCDIRVEKVELPNVGDNNSGGDGGSLSLDTPNATLGSTVPTGAPSSLPSSVDGLLSGGVNVDSGLAAIGQSVAQQFGGAGGAGGMLSMVMGFVYPSLKILLEASIRRVTVTVRWREGVNPKEMKFMQYVTNPARGGFALSAASDGGAGGISDSGVVDAATTTTSTPTGAGLFGLGGGQ